MGTFAVDGQVYAQPLYVPGVLIGGQLHNVLYVATMGNSVYAFDADAPGVSTPLWQVNLGPAIPSGFYNFDDILPEIGILSTPAIDSANQVIYVVSNTLAPGVLSVPVFQLHALSLMDGHEMYGGPSVIAATAAGNGAGSDDGSIAFDATQQLQRPGLMLANGTLYIAFGSHADAGNYHGWLMAYDPSTLRLKAAFNTSPNGRQAAFWQSGRAPAIDAAGDVYAVTGNGDFDGQLDFGETAMRFSGSDLTLKDWYTPQEWNDLNAQDQDLGSTGAIVIPNTNLILAGGKGGVLYLIQANSMGHLGPDNTNSVQGVEVNTWGIFNMVLWPQANPIIYECEPSVSLKAYRIVGNRLNPAIASQYIPKSASQYCGLTLSANGTQDGIIWMTTGNDDEAGVPGTLHALDALNLTRELWNSDQAGSRDTLGRFAKFAPPTVVNGRVYVPTFSNTVVVYGPLEEEQEPEATISAVLNAASFLEGPVSPGELVTIFGANLGPDIDDGPELQGQTVSSSAQGMSVLFDGTPAPLLYTSPAQINTVVPFDVTGPTTQIQVMYQNEVMASTTVPVQGASPALFSVNGNGGGQGAILNQDLTVNSRSNPASRGSVVVLYLTGAGLTTPPSQDGLLTAAPYPQPDLPVSVTIAGEPANILYAGAAPGLIAGVIQINLVVPQDAWVAPFDQVVVTIGNYSSPDAVTLAVQ